MDSNGLPRINQLAEAAGMSSSSVTRIIDNEGRRTRGARPSSVVALAEALQVPPARVASWLSRSWVEWKPPEEVRYLTARDLSVIDQMILALAQARRDSTGGVSEVTGVRPTDNGKAKAVRPVTTGRIAARKPK